jgi:hypothetical protein
MHSTSYLLRTNLQCSKEHDKSFRATVLVSLSSVVKNADQKEMADRPPPAQSGSSETT